MAGVALLAWAFMVTRRRLHRLEAMVLLAVWFVSVVLMARDDGGSVALVSLLPSPSG